MRRAQRTALPPSAETPAGLSPFMQPLHATKCGASHSVLPAHGPGASGRVAAIANGDGVGERTDRVSWPADAWGGKTGALARAFDWSATPLGPLADWPRALPAIVAFAFESAQPARTRDRMLDLLADQPEQHRPTGRALDGEEFTVVARFGDPEAASTR